MSVNPARESKVTRRSFISRSARTAGAIGALSAAPSILATGGSPAEKIRVAVAGVRGRGRNHVQGFSALDDIDIVALCDPDSKVLRQRATELEKQGKPVPKQYGDIRKLLEDSSIDALVVATPDHWHAPATIWACQAGKDVYVEKPCAHNFREARLMVEAARKYGRIVQHGTQSRSASHIREAIEFLHSGKLGRILQAKAINSQRRRNIGRKPDGKTPPGVDYDQWLGPAPTRPFNPNRFHYNWHWFWDYGTGDMGNDGAHQLDLARWGLGDPALPVHVNCGAGKFYFDDDQQTPDTQLAFFDYGDRSLVYEMRIWTPYPEHGVDNGNVFYGENGYMVMHRSRTWQVWWKDGTKGPGSDPKNNRGEDHRQDFIRSMRSRKAPVAEIEKGFHSSALALLGNIACRTGRGFRFDPEKQTIPDDAEARGLLSREYRKGFEVKDEV